MKLQCADCHKAVSNELPENTVVRGVAICPECLEKEEATKEQIVAIIMRYEDALSDGYKYYDGADAVDRLADELIKVWRGGKK
jgi:predicted amidophosphoribosyltransferase